MECVYLAVCQTWLDTIIGVGAWRALVPVWKRFVPLLPACLFDLCYQRGIYLDNRDGGAVDPCKRIGKPGAVASWESMKASELKAEASRVGISGNTRQELLAQLSNSVTTSSSSGSLAASASQPHSPRFRFSLPSLGCIGLQSPEHGAHDDEADLKVDRPPHPRTNSQTMLLLHDRFHGQSHQSCEHRSTEWIAQLSTVNTSVQEQNNRVRQRWNTFLTQAQPNVFMFLLRLLTHLRNRELSRLKFEELKKGAGEHLTVGQCSHCLAMGLTACVCV